ncbi:glycosyl hydrolase family 18 protein [Branchiibius sp. NY16-3462-2]|uniref:glycosyl hydrolase family 18 protein n=1 Tax=Branchiibius sp. NY16-3462-2 TaxID=1807500 RepID=UPI000795796B|nr:glycosyl hydrolase family 18 protein [Branchiibius sp. NY16-3462-2]KYH46033.1 chitinase [Branchiibius sp. NY16-3462-2]
MKQIRFAAAVAAGLAMVATGMGSATASAHSAATHDSRWNRPPSLTSGLPSRVAAPYVDVTGVSDLAKVSQQSGSKYLTLAFLQTAAAGSCDLTWAGDATKPISAAVYGDQIRDIQRRGGNVIPSLGGFTADTTGTELGDSCSDPDKIAVSLIKLFTTYRVHRVDLDIEADSINNAAGVDRRNQAIAKVQEWGKRHHYPVSFSYTLPSTPQGLAPSGLAVLASAARFHAKIDVVNIMTFDYWDGAQHDMLADAKTAATGLTAQLKSTILPHASTAHLWRSVGITQMIGIDDFGPTETYSVDQAKALVSWARQKGVSSMSFWALQRDNGTCPGKVGQNDCSGIAQSQWEFSKAYARFTS